MYTQRSAITMLAFFFSASKMSDHNDDEPPNRNWKQVCCNSLIGTLCAICYYLDMNTFDPYPFLAIPSSSTFWLGGFLAFYSCTTADTWASEIGITSTAPPRLITQPWRSVPKGTNGAVSVLGLWASVAGGLFIGVTFYLSSFVTLQQVQESKESELNLDHLRESEASQYWLIVVATVCGFMGSLLDSILGATLQYSGISKKHKGKIFEDPSATKSMIYISGRFILSNNGVNFVSTLITCIVGGVVCVWIFS